MGPGSSTPTGAGVTKTSVLGTVHDLLSRGDGDDGGALSASDLASAVTPAPRHAAAFGVYDAGVDGPAAPLMQVRRRVSGARASFDAAADVAASRQSLVLPRCVQARVNASLQMIARRNAVLSAAVKSAQQREVAVSRREHACGAREDVIETLVRVRSTARSQVRRWLAQCDAPAFACRRRSPTWRRCKSGRRRCSRPLTRPNTGTRSCSGCALHPPYRRRGDGPGMATGWLRCDRRSIRTVAPRALVPPAPTSPCHPT